MSAETETQVYSLAVCQGFQ